MCLSPFINMVYVHACAHRRGAHLGAAAPSPLVAAAAAPPTSSQLQSSEPFLVMELCRCSLKDFLKDARLTEREILLIARDIAAGLAHLHRHGVAHRDLNLGNFLFSDTGRVKGRAWPPGKCSGNRDE